MARRLSHITGPSAVLVSLMFGVEPEQGSQVVFITSKGQAGAAVRLDLERYISEVGEGVAEANAQFGGSLRVEAIQVVPDDSPSPGQVKYVSYLLARHAITGDDYG